MTTQRWIIVVSTLAAGLLMALICLSFPHWASTPAPAIGFAGFWNNHPNTAPGWSDYVVGAASFGLYGSTLFVYAESPWKQNVAITAAAIVWGALSWFVDLFPVLAGLWVAFATLYATKRWDAENLRRGKTQNEHFTFGRGRWEAAGCLVLGVGFSVGLKYGLSQGLMGGSVATALCFILPVGLIEVVIGIRQMQPKLRTPPPML